MEALLARKTEEMGGVLTSREEEYVRLQVERNDLVMQFPQSESRGEEVVKRLQRIKNRLKKLTKGRPVGDVLKLPLRSDQPKTAAERTSACRRNMSKEARDKNREDDRKRKASPEELEKAKKRMKAPEQVEKAKKRMKAPEQVEKARVRMQAPEQLERGRERKKTPEEVEKAKVRMQTPEQVEKAKVRMSLPVNREKDAARKKEKRRLDREDKERSDEWPKAPWMPHPLHVVFPTDDMWVVLDGVDWTRDDIFNWRPIVEGPTYSPDQPLRIRAQFTCYPPPTIVWLKDEKVLARDTIKYAVKEGVNAMSDCKKERLAPESKLRFQVESHYRFKLPGVPGTRDKFTGKLEWTPAKLKHEGWSDFIIPEPKLIDEGVYEVRIFNSYGVFNDFIEVRIHIDNIAISLVAPNL